MAIQVQYDSKDNYGWNKRVHLSEALDRVTYYLSRGERSISTGNINDQYRLFSWLVRFTGEVKVYIYFDSDVDENTPDDQWIKHRTHKELNITKITDGIVGDLEETALGAIRFVVQSGVATISTRAAFKMEHKYKSLTP